ncbi:MAG: CoB--CoM heterodisulfide reductase iron-sulfur subunit A family protein [Deltaproteobacteria bacterium]|nr:MAG: CoB--CoM heterodisulfide reductase iron-sulfur subunit A family protein [Deltaproteobacteria bacterium]
MSEDRIGVFICHCGTNIAGTVNCQRVAEAVARADVALVREHAYMCTGGQAQIVSDIQEYGLDRIVVAACSPRIHDETFRAVCKEAGINPYMMEMVNIREQCSWCHTYEPDDATRKSIDLILMGIEKVRLNRPLSPIEVPMTKRALVIGGGISGIEAALQLGDLGHQVTLVERSPTIGGKMAQLNKIFPDQNCSP